MGQGTGTKVGHTKTLADFRVGDEVVVLSSQWDIHPPGTIGRVVEVGRIPSAPSIASSAVWVDARGDHNPYFPEEIELTRAARCVRSCEGINPEAVPDLLAEATAVVDAWDEDEIGQIDGELIDNLRAAIAKAKGGAA